MALSDLILRARLNYQDVKEHTDWDHLMINDYLGIAQSEELTTSQVDDNTAQILENAQDIASLTIQQLINTANIADNTAAIEVNTLSIEDAHQLIGALVIQNGKLRADISINRSVSNDNAQLASRV